MKAVRDKSKRSGQTLPDVRAVPAQHEVDALIAMFSQGRYAEGEGVAREMTQRYPRYGFGWKVLGTMLKAQGRSQDALPVMQQAARLAPKDPEANSNLGVVFGELGRWQEAEVAYRNAIRLDPAFANAHFNLGLTLQAQAKYPQAEQSFRRALQLNPGWLDCELNLAYMQYVQRKLTDAAQQYRRVLAKQANLPDAHNNLGNILKDQGQYAEAEASYRSALALRPDYAEAHNNLGIVFKLQGRSDNAEASYRRAIELGPEFAEAHFNLGICLAEQHRWAEAEQSYREALRVRDDYADAWDNLGNVLDTQRRFSDAERCHRRALQLRPEHADSHCNLGNSLRSQRRFEEAEASYRKALTLNPSLAEGWHNLGIVLAERNCLAEAEQAYRRALTVNPRYAEAHKNLGNVLKEQGYFGDAEACYRQALAIRPDYIDALSNLLFDLNYTATHSIALCLEQAREYGRVVQRVAANKQCASWTYVAPPKRLRVGMVSGDLRNHPVGFFLESLLNNLDSERVELIAYSAHHEADDLTSRIRPRFTEWRSIVDSDDQEAANIIRNDGVHVLLDLSGHTARNRLAMFALRPAPVQASWLGYFATTGVAAMDYLIGDPHVTPADEESHFIERVWRLPESYLCFTPPDVAVEVGVLPALSNGYLTFGCFNNLTKMTDAVVALWSKVLLAVPTSRLLLKTKQLGDAHSRALTERRFLAHGIAAERLLLEGAAPRAELLAAYNRVDIALDPFPYPGGTTSVESLWMGVPVITRRGDRFLSHVGETIAHNAGLSAWIAASDDEYIAKATSEATNLKQLADLRAALRSQVLASPLFDAPRFARHFESALWGMWEHRSASKDLSNS